MLFSSIDPRDKTAVLKDKYSSLSRIRPRLVKYHSKMERNYPKGIYLYTRIEDKVAASKNSLTHSDIQID